MPSIDKKPKYLYAEVNSNPEETMALIEFYKKRVPESIHLTAHVRELLAATKRQWFRVRYELLFSQGTFRDLYYLIPDTPPPGRVTGAVFCNNGIVEFNPLELKWWIEKPDTIDVSSGYQYHDYAYQTWRNGGLIIHIVYVAPHI